MIKNKLGDSALGIIVCLTNTYRLRKEERQSRHRNDVQHCKLNELRLVECGRQLFHVYGGFLPLSWYWLCPRLHAKDKVSNGNVDMT